MIEELRAAAGHIAGRAMGGAIIGAGVNGYEYSQTGAGFGGSFSMGESLVSGAAAGAIVGGVVGALGAKRVAQAAGARAAKAAAKKTAGATSKARVKFNSPAKRADSIINADRAAANDYRRSLNSQARRDGLNNLKNKFGNYLKTSTKTNPINPVKAIESKYGVNPRDTRSANEVAESRAAAAAQRAKIRRENDLFNQSMAAANSPRVDKRAELITKFTDLLRGQQERAPTTPNVFSFAPEKAAKSKPAPSGGKSNKMGNTRRKGARK